MKNNTKAILKQGISLAYILLFASLFFTACSVGIIITTVSNGVFTVIGLAIFVCVLVSAFLFFAIFWFIQGLKMLVRYFQSLRALKHGLDDTATICGYSKIALAHHFNWGYKFYYSLKLRFFDDAGKEVLYKTGYNYNREQLKQLQAMLSIRIKRYNNTAVIVEEFYDEYEFDELPKKLKTNSILVLVLAWISIALSVVGICLCIFNFSKWALGILISGILLLVISTVLKAFILSATTKFAKNDLKHVRAAENKAQKRKRWKEMEMQRAKQKDDDHEQ